MALQEQLIDAWRKAPAMLRDGQMHIEVSFTVGLLAGSGYPHSAMFVLAMAQDILGDDDPEMMALRAKLGLPQ